MGKKEGRVKRGRETMRRKEEEEEKSEKKTETRIIRRKMKG